MAQTVSSVEEQYHSEKCRTVPVVCINPDDNNNSIVCYNDSAAARPCFVYHMHSGAAISRKFVWPDIPEGTGYADCTVEDYTSVEQQPEVYITFQGDSRHTYGENLYRLQESEGHLRLTKEFALSATLPNNLDILLRSPVDDVRWHPGTTATLSNILITLEYGK